MSVMNLRVKPSAEAENKLCPLVQNSFSGRVVTLLSDPVKSAKFLTEIAERIERYMPGTSIGSFNDLKHCYKLGSLFIWVGNTNDHVQGFWNKKIFEFKYLPSNGNYLVKNDLVSWLKLSCDAFNAVAYLTCCLAMTQFKRHTTVLKHGLTALQDCEVLFSKLATLYRNGFTIDQIAPIALLMVGTLCDLCFRLTVINLFPISNSIQMAADLIGFAIFLGDKLLGESKEAQSILNLDGENCHVLDLARKA